MYYLDLTNQIMFFVMLCFSLSIMVLAAFLQRAEAVLRLFGAVFLTPFCLAAASFFTASETKAKAFIAAAELITVLTVLLFQLIKTKSRMHKPVFFILLLLPAVTVLSIEYIGIVPYYLSSIYFFVPVLSAGTLISMFLLRKSRGTESILFWAMAALLGRGLILLAGKSELTGYSSLVLKAAGFFAFALYYYRASRSAITQKINDAERKLSAVNKSLDLEVKKRIFEIERSHEKLVSISKTDPLTKALNKAAIFEKIEALIENKSVREFSLMMFDIDKFKQINDTLGHIEGDKCIKKLSLIAGSCIRDIDHLGRFGGDEFVIILPGVTAPQARLIAERFRKKVDETESPHFSVSIGISAYPHDSNTMKGLLSVADDGLYASKQNGRNMVTHKGVL